MSLLSKLFGGKSLKPNRIPLQWDDVTAEWMTAAIASKHPDAKVGEVNIVTRDDGTNRRARFALSYTEGDGPTSVFLKAHAASHRIVHLRNGNLFNEARLFASEVSLPVDHPVVYKSVIDYLRLDFLLVMEDLMERDADPRDALRPMTVEQVADGLRGLAKLHSQFWEFSNKTHPTLKWVKTWQPSVGWQTGLKKWVPRGLERAEGQISPSVLALSGDEVVQIWARYVGTLATGPSTLLHGDAHIGNTYVMNNSVVGFLDWQVARRGNWSQDVGYFLVSALTVDDRRKHEKSLIAEYWRALTVPEAQRPTAEQVWLWYRATPAYGLAIWLSTLGTDGYQSQEISLSLAQRFASAFVELDTLSALDKLGA